MDLRDRRRGTAVIPRSGKKGRKRRFRRRLFSLVLICVLALAALMGTPLGSGLRNALALGGSSARLQQYARGHGLSASDYPEKLVELYERNPETEQFVFEYPLMKDNPPSDDLSGLDTSSVPLLMQWGQRWGYGQYAGNLFGLSGCGPTCLSMVAIYLTGDTSMTPRWMGEFASSHGYAVGGSGGSSG